mmetsp:Transcript_12070/g.19090  ORF Transcript_12070/g.19090 Transcript_12070/m.19090 type:complete len:437 (+) Transcript_12070:1003-2313(+)
MHYIGFLACLSCNLLLVLCTCFGSRCCLGICLQLLLVFGNFALIVVELPPLLSLPILLISSDLSRWPHRGGILHEKFVVFALSVDLVLFVLYDLGRAAVVSHVGVADRNSSGVVRVACIARYHSSPHFPIKVGVSPSVERLGEGCSGGRCLLVLSKPSQSFHLLPPIRGALVAVVMHNEMVLVHLLAFAVLAVRAVGLIRRRDKVGEAVDRVLEKLAINVPGTAGLQDLALSPGHDMHALNLVLIIVQVRHQVSVDGRHRSESMLPSTPQCQCACTLCGHVPSEHVSSCVAHTTHIGLLWRCSAPYLCHGERSACVTHDLRSCADGVSQLGGGVQHRKGVLSSVHSAPIVVRKNVLGTNALLCNFFCAQLVLLHDHRLNQWRVPDAGCLQKLLHLIVPHAGNVRQKAGRLFLPSSFLFFLPLDGRLCKYIFAHRRV